MYIYIYIHICLSIFSSFLMSNICHVVLNTEHKNQKKSFQYWCVTLILLSEWNHNIVITKSVGFLIKVFFPLPVKIQKLRRFLSQKDSEKESNCFIIFPGRQQLLILGNMVKQPKINKLCVPQFLFFWD